MGYVESVVLALSTDDNIRRVTKFISPTHTVKATRQKKSATLRRGFTVVVSVGKPNYAERKFIAARKKSGEPFPIKKLQINRYPHLKAKKAA